MKLITAGVASAVLAAGVAGGVAAYRSQAGPEISADRSATQSVEPIAADPPARVRWAPCEDGSRLEKGVCVTDVVRTVVVPAPPPAPPPPALRAATPATDDRDEGEDRGEDDDDQDDDHEGDNHGEDGEHDD